MCARSILSVSLGSFIFFNKSKVGSHFTRLSVLLCVMQIELLGGHKPTPQPLPAFDGLETTQPRGLILKYPLTGRC